MICIPKRTTLALICLILLLDSSPGWGQSEAPTIHKTFYKNGNLQSIRRQGFFKGCGVPLATDSSFTKQGKLSATIAYIHLKQGIETGCHNIQTFEKRERFNNAGKCIEIVFYKYYYEQAPLISDQQEFTAAERIAIK
jgi:hypothetical protein